MAHINGQKPNLYVALTFLVLIDFAYQRNVSDPLNPVKLWLLGFLAAWCFAHLGSHLRSISIFRKELSFKIYLGILSLFLGSLFVAFLITPVKSTALFGDSGRNLGFLNYLFLVIVGLYMATNISLENLKSIYQTCFALTFLLSTYGCLQHFKIDFIQWVNPYNSVILFTGNPDFAASLLGILAVLCFSGLFLDFSKFVHVFLGALVVFTGIVIYFSRALQGIVVFLVGIGIVLLIFLFQKSPRLALGLLSAEIIVGIYSLCGMLNLGPGARYFHKSSVIDRGFYWRSAWGMFRNHPWFGVGVDRFNDYFLQYRSMEYPLKYGYTQTANNAHNVFLQFLATAGIFVALSYISLVLFIGYRAYVVLRMRSGRDQMLVGGVIAAWIVFIGQQVISVDITAISVWGWVLGATIIALSFHEAEEAKAVSGGKVPKRGSSKRKIAGGKNISVQIFIFGFAAIVVTTAVIPMYRGYTQTARFNVTQLPNTSYGQKLYLEEAKKIFNIPLLNPNDKGGIATTLAKNNFGTESINYFKQTITTDPRNVNAHSTLSLVYENLKQFKNAIVERKILKTLDPYGADNLLKLESDYLAIGNAKEAVVIKNLILVMAPDTEVAKSADAALKTGVRGRN
jgi:O-antigen ligase